MTTKNWQLLNQVINGDCLEVMKQIEDQSVDMILCDLPYGTTACKWDTVIDFDLLWAAYKRIIKANGAIVLTASQPFTSLLVASNIKQFGYELIWEKSHPSNPLLAKKQILKYHESVLLFYQKAPNYNPQMAPGNKNHGDRRYLTGGTMKSEIRNNQELKLLNDTKGDGMKYPKSVLKFPSVQHQNRFHPTQKPVALFEYLIKTYSNPGETILDNCLGSGTTAVAAINTDRNFIGIELDPGYCEIARQRIETAKQSKLNLE